MQNRILQVLKDSHLFEGLRPELIDKIASSGTQKTIAAGEILFQKGDPANALWGVLSGRIAIEIGTDDGKEMVLEIIGEGEVFGEVGVLDFGPRRVEAKAVQESELFRLDRQHFLRHLHSSPELCFRMFSLLCSHLRQTTENLEDTALHKLTGRLAKRLITLAANSENDPNSLQLASQSDLASMLGVNREAINRHLREFEKNGLIKIGRGHIEILDRKALAEMATPGQNGHRTEWGKEDLVSLRRESFTNHYKIADNTTEQEPHKAGLLAVDAAEYSRSLMCDAAGTLRQIEVGLKVVERTIKQHQGSVIWHTGDRVLAEFPEAGLAVQAALEIQQQVNPNSSSGQNSNATRQESLFRIGVHFGEVPTKSSHFLGETINIAIRLTQLSGAGGVAISRTVRDMLENREQLELRFLGDHELKNVSATVPVYAARTTSKFKALGIRAGALLPRRFRRVALAATLTLLAAGTWFAGDWSGRQKAPTIVTIPPLSIVVLPFATGENTSLDYLADGIPENIRELLRTIPGIHLIGRESSEYYRDNPASMEQMGRDLGVAWVLHGRVIQTDDQIVFEVNLENTVIETQSWKETFSVSARRSASDSPDLSVAIVRRAASSMGITDENSKSLALFSLLTTNPEAHGYYLRAQYEFRLGQERTILKAHSLLQAAIKADPNFAEAYALLANLVRHFYPLDQLDEYTPEMRAELSKQYLGKAVLLKPDSPHVLAESANWRVWDGDIEGAEALISKALQIDPVNMDALLAHGRVLAIRRDYVELGKFAEHILTLEPLSLTSMRAAFSSRMRAGRYQYALDLAERALALYPEADALNAYSWVADSKMKLGDRLGAIEAYRKGEPESNPLDLWTGIKHDQTAIKAFWEWQSQFVHVYLGDYDQARQIMINRYDSPVSQINWLQDITYLIYRAELESIAGNYATSIEFFERARLLINEDSHGLQWPQMYTKTAVVRQSHCALALLLAYRKTGQDEQADVLSQQFADLLVEARESIATVDDKAHYQLLYKEAQYHAIEGRTDEAIRVLRDWVDHGVIFTYISWDPYLENLRGESEFEAIVAEVETELAAVRVRYHTRQSEIGQEEGA